jgi:hypothetical protein
MHRDVCGRVDPMTAARGLRVGSMELLVPGVVAFAIATAHGANPDAACRHGDTCERSGKPVRMTTCARASLPGPEPTS